VRAFAVIGFISVVAAATAAASHTSTLQSQSRPPAGQSTPPVQPPAGAAAPGAPQAPGGPPPPAVPASRRFTSDAGMIFNKIKPDKVGDFEMVMGRVKEALAKSENPKRKQMALSWRVFKGLEAGPGGNYIYVFWFDPPIKDEDYQITSILGEAFPNELQDLWAKFTQCFVDGQTMLNLQQVVNMSPNATPTTPK